MYHFTNDNDNNPRRKVLSTLSNSQTKPIQTDLKSYFENQNRSNKPKLELEPSNDQKLFNPQQKNNEKQEKIEISNQNLYEQKLKQALKEAIDENEILRSRVIELEALYAASEDEIEKKDKAILEMYEALKNEINIEEKKNIILKMDNYFNDNDNLITVKPAEKNIKKKQKLNKSF